MAKKIRLAVRLPWLCLTGASVAWGVLFYRHYWQAAIPAFGEISVHLMRLRYVLWGYSGGGVALAFMWGLALRRRTRNAANARPEGLRQRGN
jgi:hypothetical protein